jgi:hypothetical protein
MYSYLAVSYKLPALGEVRERLRKTEEAAKKQMKKIGEREVHGSGELVDMHLVERRGPPEVIEQEQSARSDAVPARAGAFSRVARLERERHYGRRAVSDEVVKDDGTHRG